MALPLPPGPKGHWFLGNLRAYTSDPLGFPQLCARAFGDVVGLHLGPRRVYLVMHPDPIEQVLVTNNRNFKKDFTIRFYRPVLGNGLLSSDGAFWLRQRRLVQPAFLKSRIAAYGEVMVSYAERMLAKWRDGQMLDIHAEFMRLALEIAAKTLFDTEVDEETYEIGAALETALHCIDNRFNGAFWLPYWVPTANNRALHRAVARLDQILYRLIAQRRRSSKDRGDLLSILLQARDENDGGGMTDRQLRDEAMTLLLAGHETTALALSWTWYLLAQHPEAMARLRSEVENLLGGRPPTVADLPQLGYAEHVITEGMRLYPPAYGMGRECIEDCELMGYRVPAGTTLFLMQWVVHHDARFFTDPNEFRPERWSDGWRERLPKYAYFPFGGGPRLCIGNTFAMMEATLVLAAMAQHVTMTLDPNHQVQLWPSITLRPAHGIRAVIHKRQRASARIQTATVAQTLD
jgi:cytochrome P450